MDTTQLLFGILWGAVGMGYFVYGKRQQRVVPLFCGLGLMLFPYFVEGWILLLIVGTVLTVLPFVIR
jgi:hypothetical protein